MLRTITAAALTIMLTIYLPSGAEAMVLGGSNFPMLGYPDPECTKPVDRPIRPLDLGDPEEVDFYNSQVVEYNSEVHEYIDCIRAYIDNSNNDIERIKEKIQQAVDEAKSL
jgi:hypothetical protein